MTAPRRTKALVASERALWRAREDLAAGRCDPWRVTEAQARYDAALTEALLGGGRLAPVDLDEDVPSMLIGRGGR